MFTNWLTGPSSSSTTSTAASLVGGESGAIAVAATAAGIMSTPPDVVLEVGPAPSVRFVAHSIVLGMHSGYLRSAIRLDESAAIAAAAAASAELLLYLGNVTAEQFAPLLTYMYTGYLDLNVENIFGVLLATHVLHMPRALEICRSFLARAQTEGYLGSGGGSLPSLATRAAATTSVGVGGGGVGGGGGKIIRPIPSKATLPNYGFMPSAAAAAAATAAALVVPAAASMTHLHTLPPAPPTTSTSYKSLQQAYAEHAAAIADADDCERREHIDVERTSNRDEATRFDDADGEDEEVEVFIDSDSSETDVDADVDNDECAISVMSRCSWPPQSQSQLCSASVVESREKVVVVAATPAAAAAKREQPQTEAINPDGKRHALTPRAPNRSGTCGTVAAAAAAGTNSKQTRRERRKQQQQTRHNKSATTAATTTTTTGLQVAKAPIPASQLVDAAVERSKVIIDVASCDGPVRFRRILNKAYGHKPDAFATAPPPPERSQQSVSLSFHQQMARTISQQRQLQRADESENSESSGGGGGGGPSGAANTGGGGKVGGSGSGSGGKHSTSEIYVCVYCKHTFKSQYCYQKHAKRHLNPLNLNLNCAASLTTAAGEHHSEKHTMAMATASATTTTTATTMIAGAPVRAHTLPLPPPPSLAGGKSQSSTTAELLRREVRPLDMNVQYYPCKTCGSKFPSYYFVHKHRKMCHADEEAAANETTGATRVAAAATTGGTGANSAAATVEGTGPLRAGETGAAAEAAEIGGIVEPHADNKRSPLR